jgi:endonuclease/exonuclease/phosphatase family metal-dependent hydrolase
VKLIQLNAWGGRLEFPIEFYLGEENPDILCLQEAISFGAGSGTGLFITTENIQSKFGLSFEAFAPSFSFRYMKGVAKFGNGIFSKQPIMKSESVFTYLEHQDDFMWGEHNNNMRNFVHAEIDANGKTVHVLTHHGYWLHEHKNGNDETLRQMGILADYIEGLDGPVILTGDFNLAPGSKSLTRLNTLLTNLTLKEKLETTRSVLTTKTEACDYIFVNDMVKVKSFKPSDRIVSDHKALELEFDL